MQRRSAIVDSTNVNAGWAVLSLLLGVFFGLGRSGVPISAVAGAGALVLLGVAARGHRISTRMLIREAPWQVVVFSLGMYLVVYGLRNEGLTDHLATLLYLFAGYGVWGATFGTGLLIAFLSSIMNNMPTVLVGALSIDASQAEGIVREAMIHANVIGSDLGPKFTPIDRKSTRLWLHVRARKHTSELQSL